MACPTARHPPRLPVPEIRRLCVYCGSSAGARPAYAEATAEVGRLIAGEGIGVVYGGGHVGLMGVLADSAMAAGGEVIGVMPQALVDREIAHTGIADLRVVQSMHERKAMMADMADGFVVAEEAGLVFPGHVSALHAPLPGREG